MDNICGNSDVLDLLELLGTFFRIFLIVIPIIIIIYGVFDFFKLLITEEKKNIKVFLKRVISGILCFFIIPFVKVIFSSFGVIDNDCFKTFFGENLDSSYITTVENVSSEDECKELQEPYIWLDGSCRIDISKENIND